MKRHFKYKVYLNGGKLIIECRNDKDLKEVEQLISEKNLGKYKIKKL